MVKKIMMDMKLNGRRVIKSPEKEIKPLPEIKPVKETPAQAPIQQKTFSENESLKKASVFVSGWQAIPPMKEEARKDIVKDNNINTAETLKRLSQTPQLKRKSGGVRKPIFTIFIISLLLGLGYWGAMAFEKTTIVIQEKHKVFTIDKAPFTASKDTKSPINFEIMIVSDTESKDITLTESQNVSLKAQGTVTLYNENSTKPQNLLIKTFISDPEGKTYYTDKAVTIPGYKIDGSKIIPGQVDVGITAFLPGDAYNGNPKDFTINGFKGTDKFKKIYAKAVTPLSGGAQGLTYTLGAADKGSLNATAGSAFKTRMIKKVNAEVPQGYILYPDALSFSYTIGGAQSPTPNAKVNIDGVLSAVILKESDVSDAVIKKVLPDIGDKEQDEIQVPDISKLSFKFLNPDQVITKDLQSVPFTLTGTINPIWHPDIEALKLQLIGVSKKSLPVLFKADPGIAEASARLFPPWQKYLPEDLSKINIKVK